MDDMELPERTKLEMDAGRKQATENAAAMERAFKAREDERTPPPVAEKVEADAAVADAEKAFVEKKGKDRGRP